MIRCGGHRPSEGNVMLKWAAIFFVISIIAALFGFTDISAGAAGIAQFLFWIFVVVFVLLLIGGLVLFKK